jgi:hypothetical protein
MTYISLNKFVAEYKTQLPFTSFPTIRNYVVNDIETKNILKVKVLPHKLGKGRSGLRYYIPIVNIPLFIEKLGENKNSNK